MRETFPLLANVCCVLETGLIGSPLVFSSGWDKEKANEYLGGLSSYLFSSAALIVCYPLTVFMICARIAYKAETDHGETIPEVKDNHVEINRAPNPRVGMKWLLPRHTKIKFYGANMTCLRIHHLLS